MLTRSSTTEGTTQIGAPVVARSEATYDALVIGAGATGSLAALLLTEAGLRVLVLDAGIARSKFSLLWSRLARGALRRMLGPSAVERLGRRRQAIQSHCYAWQQAPEAFVDDVDCPYVTCPDHPFIWLRARQLGGRMVIPGHGRQYYRLGSNDLAPGDGLSPPWPFPAAELDRWYASVERRLGIAGAHDNVPWLPDCELSRVLEATPAEERLKRSILARWLGARPILGRFAPPLDALETAVRTGRLLVQPGAIAREIEVDRADHVRGVVWIDARDGSEHVARSRLVFLCASALESTRLLLLSGTGRRPGGLGAASGALGRYLMDHVKVAAHGQGEPISARAYEQGRCIYLPRFDARDRSEPGSGRGFGVQVNQTSANGRPSHFTATSFAEMLPRSENRVSLDPERKDAWGIPILNIDCRHGEAELSRARDQTAALRELAEVANVTLSKIDDIPALPGSTNHECGTARMGSDPGNSVLNAHNECWEAKGLYVTDGACFPSQGSQNPTLTFLALTARACDHARQTARDARTKASQD